MDAAVDRPLPRMTTGRLWGMPWVAVWVSGHPFMVACDTGLGVVGTFDLHGTSSATETEADKRRRRERRERLGVNR